MDRAIFELSEKLRHPSDIATKLDEVEKQLDEAYTIYSQNFIRKLTTAYREIEEISESIKQVSIEVDSFNKQKEDNIQTLQEFTGLINDSKTVLNICKAYQNFKEAKWLLEALEKVEEECQSDDILDYHTKVYEKEELMYKIEPYNYGLERDDFMEISKICNEIKRQSLEFSTLIMEVVDDYILNADLFAKIVEIVRKEEARDALTRKVSEGDKKKDIVMEQYARTYPQYITRPCKNLQESIKRVIKSAIEAKFASLDPDLDSSDEKGIFTTHLDFIFSDIEKIYSKIRLCFFTFDEFVSEYHSHLKRSIDKNIDSLDAGEILALLEFQSKYYTTMESKYAKVPESLGDKLLDCESELLEKYTHTVTSKLHQWIENITMTEIEKMRSKDIDGRRDADEEDTLISHGFLRLLDIIKTQLEPISFNKKVFLAITSSVRGYCEGFRRKIVKAVEKEYELSCQGKSKPGFEDFCVMFGNSGLKLAQYVTSLPQCQSLEVRDLGNVFMGILKDCNRFLANFVLYTCKPVIKKLFTEEWYGQDLHNTLKVTLEDFLQDYKSAMKAFSFSAFIYELANVLTSAYVKRLGSKNIILKNNASRMLKRDYELLCDIFQDFLENTTELEPFALLKSLIPIIEADNPDVFAVEIESFKLRNKDFKEEIIRNMISRRKDIGPEVKEKLIVALKSVFTEEKHERKNIFSWGM